MKILHYDSLGAMLDIIDATHTTDGSTTKVPRRRGQIPDEMTGAISTWQRYGDLQWSLDSSWDSALDSLDASVLAARTMQGRDAECAAITTLAESLATTMPAPHSIRRVPTWGRSGNRVSINRVLSGHLQQAWRKTTPAVRPQHGKILTLCVPVCFSADTSATQIRWTTAASLASAMLAESAGYRVELWSVAAGGGCHDYLTMVRLKASSVPWNTQGMAIAAHASFLRRLLFRVWEQTAPHWGPLESGYGQVLSPQASVPMVEAWAHAHSIAPASLTYGCHQEDGVQNMATARAWLVRQLAQLAA